MRPELYIVIIGVYAMLFGLSRKWILNCRKDAQSKKKLFAALLVFNAVLLAVLVWSMLGFQFYWAGLVVFFLPIAAITLINILSTGFCESCATVVYNPKFWRRTKKCPTCRRLSGEENL